MRTPSSEQTKVRSIPLKSGNTIQQDYHRVGLALALFAALCFFAALWFLNGYFTARTVRGLGLHFQFAVISWGVGWLVHVIVSLIEHHLWRLRDAVANAPALVFCCVYVLVIVVGALDVFTSTLAFLALFSSLGLPILDRPVIVTSVLLAEAIAIIPEGVIVWLTVALWRVVKG